MADRSIDRDCLPRTCAERARHLQQFRLGDSGQSQPIGGDIAIGFGPQRRIARDDAICLAACSCVSIRTLRTGIGTISIGSATPIEARHASPVNDRKEADPSFSVATSTRHVPTA
ncbi:hypothetical protein [Steroidobacter agaridevorans]|uniref:hypothetical protein n=1 Tax=Steroidobacter agaridevorans TaxID=2695856 RepID=UPI00137A0145|nr:hypothetical protein [Steroidobacter agaridevorans]